MTRSSSRETNVEKQQVSILIPFETQQKWYCVRPFLKFHYFSLLNECSERRYHGVEPHGHLNRQQFPLEGWKKKMIKKNRSLTRHHKNVVLFSRFIFYFFPGREQGFQRRDRSNCERKRKKADGDINQQRLMIGMGREGLVYRITVQFKIYKRFNATAWQELKSTAQKTVTLRKILQL